MTAASKDCYPFIFILSQFSLWFREIFNSLKIYSGTQKFFPFSVQEKKKTIVLDSITSAEVHHLQKVTKLLFRAAKLQLIKIKFFLAYNYWGYQIQPHLFNKPIDQISSSKNFNVKRYKDCHYFITYDFQGTS